MIHLPIADIEVFFLWPLLAAFLIAMLSSTAGVTGAFLLLPFQISVLGFQGPSVSATNHLYNIFGGPGGIIRFIKEKRFVAPLAIVLLCGTAPGIILGVFLRILLISDPKPFKIFVGIILLLLALVLIFRPNKGSTSSNSTIDIKKGVIINSFTLSKIKYDFSGSTFTANVPVIFFFSLIVGLVSGAYGIGGGVFTSAFLVAICRLPIHTTAAATMLSTFFSSLFGVLSFVLLPILLPGLLEPASPDWLLGFLLGIGGFFGTYTGARLQKYLPGRTIRYILAVLMFLVAFKYGYETLMK